jgi:hypothetical protein
MVKRHEIFPSRHLKPADLAGKSRVVEIERAPQEELGNGADKDEKTVLYFRGGTTKPLPLNMTNWDAVAAICGDDTGGLPGHRIESYPTTTRRGSPVGPSLIRPPGRRIAAAASKPPTPLADDMDDDIPFVLGSPAVMHSPGSRRKDSIFRGRPRVKRPATANGPADATRTRPSSGRVAASAQCQRRHRYRRASGISSSTSTGSTPKRLRRRSGHCSPPATVEAVTPRGPLLLKWPQEPVCNSAGKIGVQYRYQRAG